MENSLRIHLTKGLYTLSAIESTLKDFCRICSGKLLDDSILVELTMKENIKNLKEEFCNHVLANMKND